MVRVTRRAEEDRAGGREARGIGIGVAAEQLTAEEVKVKGAKMAASLMVACSRRHWSRVAGLICLSHLVAIVQVVALVVVAVVFVGNAIRKGG